MRVIENSADQLKRIVNIIKRGKKPTNEMVFFAGLDDLYVFKGSKYTSDRLKDELTEYENINGIPFIIWHEERTYPDTQQ